jgi:hypothetical protein
MARGQWVSVCQVSFSLVNDCVAYNYEFGASSERIILYINCKTARNVADTNRVLKVLQQ